MHGFQGRHKDVTGLILQIKAKSGTVKLMSDTDHSAAIEVFAHQLVAVSAAESAAAAGAGSLCNGKYRLLDLVSLHSDSSAVGVIVKIERKQGTILCAGGRKTVPETDIKCVSR